MSRVDQTGWLVAHGLAKSFGKRAVVHDVSIAVRRGEAVGLLGPNGAGKTTVFTMIMGLIKPDAGQILLDGRPITKLPLFQRYRAMFSLRNMGTEEAVLALAHGFTDKSALFRHEIGK